MAPDRMTPGDLLAHLRAADGDTLREVTQHALQRLIELEAASKSEVSCVCAELDGELEAFRERPASTTSGDGRQRTAPPSPTSQLTKPSPAGR